MSAPPQTDLTGVWDGQFSYPRGYQPTTFTCILLEIGGSLSGSVHELSNNGPSKGQTLCAAVSGARDGAVVRFAKEYPPKTAGYGRAVIYKGVLSADGLQIEGEWTIPGSWSGRFLMIRSPRVAEAAEEQAREEAPAD
jgi:hypothetical protein